MHVSGVLSVVTAGLYIGRRTPLILSYRTRLQGGPVWSMLEFLLNGFVFILIGLQLPGILQTLSEHKDYTISQLVGYSLIISVAVIVVRLLWVFPAAYLPRLLSKKIRAKDPYPNWRHVTIIGWTGMRGVVSLAAALALQENFPGRDLILFLTFMVILATLVVQGLSLPTLIRWFGIKDDGAAIREEREARLQANRAALARLSQVTEHNPAKEDALQRLRIEYEDHIRQIEGDEAKNAHTPLRLFASEYEHLSHVALQVERNTIIELRNANVINDDVLRRIQRDIDLAEIRLQA
jgi:CPA1 family monovalent cation:H+ antiporter